MVAFLSLRRKLTNAVFGLIAAATLAACDMPVGGGTGSIFNSTRAVPVALLVPSSSANAGSIANSLENAARLAGGRAGAKKKLPTLSTREGSDLTTEQ